MILLDLNVILDVVQRRAPHHRASAALLDCVIRKEVTGALPAHAFTTVYYIVSRYQDHVTASRVIDWLLVRFIVAAVGRAELLRAQALAFSDFEDAVVAALAEHPAAPPLLPATCRVSRLPRYLRSLLMSICWTWRMVVIGITDSQALPRRPSH